MLSRDCRNIRRRLAVMKSKGFMPDIVSGHSVGEYSALVASGVLSLGDAVRLVNVRGRLMEEAVPPGQAEWPLFWD